MSEPTWRGAVTASGIASFGSASPVPLWVTNTFDHRYGIGGGRNARANVLAWNALRGENGAALVRLIESADGVWIRIERPPNNPNAWGTANCGARLIRLHPDLRFNDARFRTTLQHEIGHTMGLSHSQAVPRDDGRYPLMSTCQSTARQEQRQLSQDDASALNFRNGGFRDLNPNPGFERNMYAWGAAGVSNFTTSGTPRSGNRAARWQGHGSYIETVAHVSAPTGRQRRGSAWVRNHTTSVQVRQASMTRSGQFGSWTQVVTPTMTTQWNTVRLLLRITNLATGGPIIVDDPRLEWNF